MVTLAEVVTITIPVVVVVAVVVKPCNRVAGVVEQLQVEQVDQEVEEAPPLN